MITKIPAFFIPVIFLFLTSCATMSGGNDMSARASAGAVAFGGHFEFFYVRTPVKIAVATVLDLYPQGLHKSRMAESLARRLALAETTETRIMVSGPNERTTRMVIGRALYLCKGKQLKHLEFLYLGSESNKDELELEQKINKLGGKFQFSTY